MIASRQFTPQPRCTIIIRSGVPTTTPIETVKALFAEPPIEAKAEVNGTWFLTFASESAAVQVHALFGIVLDLEQLLHSTVAARSLLPSLCHVASPHTLASSNHRLVSCAEVSRSRVSM